MRSKTKPDAGPAHVGAQVVHLPDANVLIALVSPSHVHRGLAEDWFRHSAVPFATCPITQGALIRVLMQAGQLSCDIALASLGHVTAHARHRFWPDSLGYAGLNWRGVIGHRQVTDAYLAALARHHQGKLVTLDRGLAGLHGDVAVALAGG